ncbi:MAG: hypothetical protein ACREL6_11205 [Gemmatimonadales bacterium]
MPFPPPADHRVSLREATEMVKRFRSSTAAQALGKAGPAGAFRGGMLPRAAVEELLAQKGCEGIRIYHAQLDDGVPTLVLVGVDKEADDMTDGVILEKFYPCPPYCPSNSPLDS